MRNFFAGVHDGFAGRVQVLPQIGGGSRFQLVGWAKNDEVNSSYEENVIEGAPGIMINLPYRGKKLLKRTLGLPIHSMRAISRMIAEVAAVAGNLFLVEEIRVGNRTQEK